MKKITLNRNILESALAVAVNYLPSKESDLEGKVTISTNGEKITISTTNYAETLAISEIEYQSEDMLDGSFSKFSIDGKKLLHVIRSVKSERLSFNIGENELTVSGGRNKVKLETIDVTFEFIFGNEGNELNITKLFNGFKSILHAIDSNNPKMELNGASLQCSKGILSLVATDTRRLAIYTTDSDSPCDIILSKESIKSILKLFDGLEPSAVVFNNMITIYTSSISYRAMLVNGTFPQWQRIVPQKLDQTFSINRMKLLELLKEASIFQAEVEIKIQNNQINITDLDGNANTVEPIETDNTNICFKINSKYMIDFLTSYSDEKVQIGFNDPKLPIMLIASPNHKEIAMPYIVNE